MDKSDFKPPDAVCTRKRIHMKKHGSISLSSGANPSDALSLQSMGDLDSTSDFSGGCTPYKTIAKTVAEKQRSGNQTRKRLKVGKSKTKVEEEKGDTSISYAKHKTDDGELTKHKVCVTCGVTVINESYEQHIKKCLINRFQRPTSSTIRIPGDDQVLQTTTKDVHVDDDNSGTDVCQFCKNHIGHLNYHRHALHINRCMDKVKEDEEKRVAADEALKNAKNKVLDCPLCGQCLNTRNSRKTHVKRCAKKYEVSASVLRERIQEQETEYHLQLEAGILPIITRPNRRRNAGNVRIGTNRSATDQGSNLLHIPEVPNSKLDEETQLALALSESLREESFRTSNVGVDLRLNSAQTTEYVNTGQEHTITGKNAFSILMTPKHDLNGPKKKARKKNVNERSYEIVKKTHDQRMMHLRDKVSLFMSSQGEGDICATPGLPSSSVATDLSCEVKPCSLWAVDSSDLTTDRDLFYVRQLQPQVFQSDVQAGSKLIEMSKIPGWKPLHPLDATIVQVTSNEDESHIHDSTTTNQTMLASTQTAVLLAELAANTTTLDITCDQNSIVTSGSHTQRSGSPLTSNKTVHFAVSEVTTEPEWSQGFCSPAEKKKRCEAAREKLVTDMRRLLNNSHDGDVRIMCRGRQKLHAHSLMIQLRCPALLQETTSEGIIDLTDHTEECVQALLRYVYVGETEVATEVAMELRHLAARLDIDELVLASTERALQKDMTDNSSTGEDNIPERSHKLIDQTLQNLLHDAWGSDSDISSDEHSEEPVKDTGKSNEKDDEDDELELDELFQLVASQNQKVDSFSEGERDAQINEVSSDGHTDAVLCDAREKMMLSFALMQKLEESFMVTSSKSSVLATPCDVEQESNNSQTLKTRQDILSISNKSQDDDDSEYDVHILHECNNHDAGSPVSESDASSVADDENGISNSRPAPFNDISLENSANRHCLSTSKFLTTPVNHISSTSRRQDETTPDLFGEPCSDEDSINIDQNAEGSKSILNSKCTREYSASPTDLFDSDYSEEADDLNKHLDHESPCPADLSSPSVCEAVINNDNDMDCLEPQHKGSPVFSSQRSKKSSNPRNSKSLCNSEELGEVGHTAAKFTCEKRKRDYLSSNSEDENPTVKRLRKNDKGSDSDDHCRVEGSARLHDISETESSPVFKKQNYTRSQRMRNSSPGAHTSQPVIDLTLEENYEKADDNSVADQSEFIGSVSLEALNSPMDETIVTGAEGKEHTEPQSLLSDCGDCDDAGSQMVPVNGSPARGCEGNSDQVGGDLCGVPRTDNPLEESGYSAADVWEDFENDDVYDFGIPATQGPATLPNECVNMMAFDRDCSPASPKTSPDLSIENEVGVDLAEPVYVDCELNSEAAADISSAKSQSPTKNPQSETPDTSLLKETSTQSLRRQSSSVSSPFRTPSHLPSRLRSRLYSPVYDPPTDMDSDMSMVLDEANDSKLWRDENMPEPSNTAAKLPLKKLGQPKSKKPWVPPSPYTPMMEYEKMVTPELKKQCQKVGVRPLPKKKMVVVLKDIYKKTHSYETDSDYDGSPRRKPPNQPVLLQPPEPKVKKRPAKSKASIKQNRCKVKDTGVDTGIKAIELSEDLSNTPVDVEEDREEINFSQEMNNSSCSQESDDVLSDLPEESILQVDDTDQGKKLSKKDEAYKRQSVWDYILAHEALHLQILHYEPLDFANFHQQLKSSGLNIGAKLVMDFLDEQNVLFTLKNQQATHRKQSKKSGSQSQRPKQNKRPSKTKRTTQSQQATQN